MKEKLKEKMDDQRWKGSLLWTKWEDDRLSENKCFAWLSGLTCAPTDTTAGVMLCYEQLYTNPSLRSL